MGGDITRGMKFAFLRKGQKLTRLNRDVADAERAENGKDGLGWGVWDAHNWTQARVHYSGMVDVQWGGGLWGNEAGFSQVGGKTLTNLSRDER